MFTARTALFFLLACSLLACGDDGGTTPRDLGPPPDVGLTDAGDRDWGPIGRDAATEDAGADGGLCVPGDTELESGHQPVDVIVVVDNSGPMLDAITAMEDGIYSDFAGPLLADGVDLRVIMLTDHGDGDLEICVPTPLSGTEDCSMPAEENEGLFYHYSVTIHSTDAPCKIFDTYRGSSAGGVADDEGVHPGGWAEYLRPNALQAFVIVTNHHMECSWAMPGISETVSECNPLFDSECFNSEASPDTNPLTSPAAAAAQNVMDQLEELDPVHFAPAGDEPPYLWYSLVTMSAAAGPGELYAPDAPLVTADCSPSESLCTGHQWVSKATGGLRGSVCATPEFDAYLEGIAQDLGERTVDPCRFPLGEGVDPFGIALRVSPAGDEPRELDLVADMDSCTNDRQFHMEGAQLRLCPLACERLGEDINPTVELVTTCE